MEYCNHPSGTFWSDQRREHGYHAPHSIKMWSLGNEMDGPWQIGHKTAGEYGRLAAEAGKVMKLVDPTIELAVCGSSYPDMPTFPDWEATVLAETYEHVDYLSIHNYYGNAKDNLSEYLAQSETMDRYIRTAVATCDFVQAKVRSKRKMMIAFDEWNVWFHTLETDKKQEPWTIGPPLLQDLYTLEDALVVGTLLITLLRHADRVKIACLAQLVNVLTPIRTEEDGPAWPQTIYFPFLHASRFGRGTVVSVIVRSPEYETEHSGPVPFLVATAVHNDAEQTLTVFAVNRDHKNFMELNCDVRSFEHFIAREHLVLDRDNPKITNSAAAQPVQPRATDLPAGENGRFTALLPPLSWNVLRFGKSFGKSR